MILHALVADDGAGVRAARAGATVIQLRLKQASTEQRVDAARRLRRGLEAAGVEVLTVMNDDVEAAAAAGLDAVHLGQGDRGADVARRLGLGVGRSAATVAEAVAADHAGALYVGAGPIWATPSKPDAGEPIGLVGLASIAAATTVPIIAIGGVNSDNAAACLNAGAGGVAVIRAAADVTALRRALDRRTLPSPGRAE